MPQHGLRFAPGRIQTQPDGAIWVYITTHGSQRIFAIETTADAHDLQTSDGRHWAVIRESRLIARSPDSLSVEISDAVITELILGITDTEEEESDDDHQSDAADASDWQKTPSKEGAHADEGANAPQPAFASYFGRRSSGPEQRPTGDDRKYDFLVKKMPTWAQGESITDFRRRVESWCLLAEKSKLFDQEVAAFTLVTSLGSNRKMLKEKLEVLPVEQRNSIAQVLAFIEKDALPFEEARTFHYLRLLLEYPQKASGDIDSRLADLDRYWAEVKPWKLPENFLGFLYISSAGLETSAEQTLVDRLASEPGGFEAANVKKHLVRMIKQTAATHTTSTTTANKELALWAPQSSSWQQLGKKPNKGKGKGNKNKGKNSPATSPGKGQQTKKWCEFHQTDTHNTAECRAVTKAMTSGNDPKMLDKMIQSASDKRFNSLLARKQGGTDTTAATSATPSAPGAANSTSSSSTIIPSHLGGAAPTITEFPGFFTTTLYLLQFAALLSSPEWGGIGIFDPGCGACVVGSVALGIYIAALTAAGMKPRFVDCAPATFSGIGGVERIAKKGVHLPAKIAGGKEFEFFAYVLDCEKTPLLLSRPLLFQDLEITLPANEGGKVFWSSEKIGISKQELQVRSGSFVLDLLSGFREAGATQHTGNANVFAAIQHPFLPAVSTSSSSCTPPKRLTRDMIVLMHKNCGFPVTEPFWGLIKLFDDSPEAKQIVDEVTAWTRKERQQQHSQYNWKLIPQSGEDLGSIDCFRWEQQWFIHWINHFSAFSRAMKIDIPNARNALRFLLMLRLHGNITKSVLTDMGPEFLNLLVWSFLTSLGITHLVSASQAHWDAGKNERRIQLLKFVAERCRKSDAFRGASAEEIMMHTICGVNEMPQATTAGYSAYEVEFCKRPVTSPYFADGDSCPPLFITMEKRTFVRRTVAEAIASRTFLNTINKKQLPATFLKEYQQHQVVDFFDEGKGWIGPGVVVGRVAPNSNIYMIAMNAKFFRKTASQMKLRRSVDAVDYPNSIQRATRTLAQQADQKNGTSSAPAEAGSSNGEIAARVYDVLFASSSAGGRPLHGSYLAATSLFTPAEKDEMMHIFKASIDAEPPKEDVVRHFAAADAREYNGLTNSEQPTIRVIEDEEEMQEIRRAGFKPVPTLITRKFKTPGDPTTAKSRICAIGTPAHDLREHVQTATPSLSKECLRILIFFCICLNFIIGTFDVKQAFTQAEPLGDDEKIYLLPPHDNSGRRTWNKGALWQLLRPLYGFRDAGLRWYRTFDEYLLKLGLIKNAYDFAFYFLPAKQAATAVEGFIGTVVDDGIYGGTRALVSLVDQICARFNIGSRKNGGTLEFCGVTIDQHPHGKFVDTHQREYIRNLQESPIPPGADQNALYDIFRSLLGQLMWVFYSRPSIIGRISLVASTTRENVRTSTIRMMNKVVRLLKATVDVVWRLIPLDLDNLCVICYTDASLNNATDDGGAGVKLKTQGGYNVWISERPKFLKNRPKGVVAKIPRGQYSTEKVKANLIHVSSKRIRRVCTSTLQAETVMVVQLVDRACSEKQ
eukprot:g15186.t1